MTEALFNIRQISTHDVQGYRDVLDIVARERRYLTVLEAFSTEQTRTFVSEMLIDGNPQYVAVADGCVVGWCDVTRHSTAVANHCGTLGMGVHPKYRGQGIGRALLATTMKAAQERGVLRVELVVYTDNQKAIELYEGAGFRIEGLHQKSALIDGRMFDSYTMAVLFN
jgi:ribosomal protein S18 acetylase RimI-like enzyme